MGSQAILATFPGASALLRASAEIDAYPVNAEEWEARHDGAEASEEINALFGYLSAFHETHGFYIDGVDATTATLPPDWRDRQCVTPVDCDGREVYVITPDLHDLVVSKLCRLDESDRTYVEALHTECPLDENLLRSLLETLAVQDEVKEAASSFIARLFRP